MMQTSSVKKQQSNSIKEFPLIGSQLGIWMGDQVTQQKNIFTVAQYIEIQGVLNAETLLRAIKTGLSEADTVHSRYHNSEDGPKQFIQKNINADSIDNLELIDLTTQGLPAQEAKIEAKRIMSNDIALELDVESNKPLYKHILIKIPANSDSEQWFWYQRYHHLMVDGFSFTAITKRITAIYASLLNNNDIGESPFKPFDSVVEEYNKYPHTKLFERDKAFWREYSSTLVAPLTLSNSTQSTSNHLNSDIIRFKFDINNKQLESINHHRSCEKLTKADLLMSVVMMYLAKMTDSEKVAIGFPFMRRMGSKALRSTGSVVNVLPLQIEIKNNATLATTAQNLLSEIKTLRQHQRYESEQIQRDAGLIGSEQKLYGPTINCKLFDYKLDFSGVSGITHQLATGPIDDLEFAIYLTETSASIEIAANTSLYNKKEIQLHADRIHYIIEQLTNDAELDLCRIKSIAPQEEALIKQWSMGQQIDVTHYGQTLLDQFKQQLETQPNNLALKFCQEEWTYQQLWSATKQLTNRLQQKIKKKPDDQPVIAVALPRCSESIISILAVFRLGAIYLPLDLSHPKDRLAMMCEDAEPAIIITNSDSVELLPGSHELLIIDSDGEDIEEKQNDFTLAHSVNPDNAAYLFFTSGSTGRPKGVVVPHSAIFNLLAGLEQTIFQKLPNEKIANRLNVALTGSLSFDTSWDPILLMLLGHPLHLYSEELKRNSQALISAINHDKIDTLALAPSLATQLMDAGLMEPQNHHPLLMDICGEAVTPSLWRKLQKHPELNAYNIYGPTEFTVYATYAKVEASIPQPTIGRPLPNTEVYILDKNLQPVPIGHQGELYLAGDNMTLGYINRPATTATNFVANPFKSGELMYLTGDIVRWNVEGHIDFIGRADNQIKVRGFRVELGEVEAALSSLKEVKEVAVTVQKVATGNRLLGYCTLNHSIASTIEINSQYIEQQLSKSLPSYMVPSVITILDQLPLTVSGKIAKKQLPLPSASQTTEQLWPKTDLEKILCHTIADVLQIENVALNDDFFNLSGDSISAMQLSTKLRQSGYELKPADIFSQRTAMKMTASMQPIKLSVHRNNNSLETINLVKPYTKQQEKKLKQRYGSDVAILPTLPLQSGLLFHAQMNQGSDKHTSDNYSFNTRLDIKGILDIKRVKHALQLVLEKHPHLGVTFDIQTTGLPSQIIADAVHQTREWPSVIHDLSTLSKKEQLKRVTQLELAEACREFAIDDNGSILAHVTFIKLSAEQWILLLTAHHLIIDGWSTPILLQDLFKAYQQLSLEKSRVSYPQVIQQLTSQDQSKAREAWKHYLDSASATILYPENQTTDQVHERHIPIDQSLLSDINTLCRDHGLTLNTVIQTTWAILLSSMTGKNDVVFGSPVSGRFSSVDGIDEHIGLFSNTIPVRVKFNSQFSILEQLHQVQDQQVQMLEHDGLGLGEVQSLAQTDTLFDTLLVVENYPASSNLFDANHHGLKLQNVTNRGYTHYPLTILVLPDKTPRVLFEYRDSVANSEHLIQRFFLILEQIASQPERKLAHLKLLNKTEQAFLGQLNQTQHQVSGLTLQQRLKQQALVSPHCKALVDHSTQYTYQEMRQQVDRVSHHLLQNNTITGDIIAIALTRSTNLSLALQGVIDAGAAYLPLDTGYPDERLQFMLEDAAPKFLITDSEHEARLQNLLPKRLPCSILKIDQLLVPTDREASSGKQISSDSASNNSVSGNDPAYMIYTSGSTGRPKGVLVSHQAIINRLEWMQHQYPLNHSDVVLQKTPASFDVSVWEFFWPLIEGASLIMTPPESHKDPTALLQLIDQYKVTTLHFVPSMLSAFVSNLEQKPAQDSSLSLKQVFCSGEALSTELTQKYAQYIKAPLHNLYGPTEAAIDVSYCPALEHIDTHSAGIPIGKPVWNTQLRVLDHYLREVGIGVAGELYISGEQLALEYYKRPSLTANRFIADPFNKGQKMYRTGDIVRWLDNGHIEYLGRTDDQLKIRGQRIEIGEIEKAIANLSGVKDAAVHARAINQTSSNMIDGDNRQLVGYIITQEPVEKKTDKSASSEFVAELIQQLKELLPPHMVPVTLVMVDRFPLSANGKLDRKALPDPEQSTTTTGRQPKAGIESIIAETYGRLLAIEAVPAEGDFFMLGGHSLLAMQLAAELSTKLQLTVSVGQIMVSPTVESLAEVLSDKELRTNPEKAGLGHVFPIRQGKGIPLFCINPGSGFSWQYTGFPKYLDGDWPIIGLQSPRPNGAVAVSTDMEAAVDMYFNQMKTIQPQGPYHFLGYSFGGTVAAALASRLEAQGEKINFLGLLDTYPPEGQEWRRPTEEEAMEEVEREKQQFLAAAQGDFSDQASLQQQNKMFNDIVANYDDTVRLLSEATTALYHGVATIFVAENSLPDGWNVAGSWKPFIKALHQHRLRFSHDDLMAPESLEVLGPLINDVLKKVPSLTQQNNNG